MTCDKSICVQGVSTRSVHVVSLSDKLILTPEYDTYSNYRVPVVCMHFIHLNMDMYYCKGPLFMRSRLFSLKCWRCVIFTLEDVKYFPHKWRKYCNIDSCAYSLILTNGLKGCSIRNYEFSLEHYTPWFMVGFFYNVIKFITASKNAITNCSSCYQYYGYGIGTVSESTYSLRVVLNLGNDD